LRELAFSDEEPEEIRRAAYKSLRRLMRIKAAEKRIEEARAAKEATS